MFFSSNLIREWFNLSKFKLENLNQLKFDLFYENERNY